MALDLRQNCVSVQYLEKKWTEFQQILSYAIILARSMSGLLQIIFAHLYQSYGPRFTPKFCFRSIF